MTVCFLFINSQNRKKIGCPEFHFFEKAFSMCTVSCVGWVWLTFMCLLCAEGWVVCKAKCDLMLWWLPLSTTAKYHSVVVGFSFVTRAKVIWQKVSSLDVADVCNRNYVDIFYYICQVASHVTKLVLGCFGTPFSGKGGRRESANVPFGRVVVVSYRLSIVTIVLYLAIWPQFAKISFACWHSWYEQCRLLSNYFGHCYYYYCYSCGSCQLDSLL